MNQEGLIKPRSAVSVRLGWRMEQATKINTYIYNEINTTHGVHLWEFCWQRYWKPLPFLI